MNWDLAPKAFELLFQWTDIKWDFICLAFWKLFIKYSWGPREHWKLNEVKLSFMKQTFKGRMEDLRFYCLSVHFYERTGILFLWRFWEKGKLLRRRSMSKPCFNHCVNTYNKTISQKLLFSLGKNANNGSRKIQKATEATQWSTLRKYCGTIGFYGKEKPPMQFISMQSPATLTE